MNTIATLPTFKASKYLPFFTLLSMLFSLELSANNKVQTITCPDDLFIQLSPGNCNTNVFYDTLAWSSSEPLTDTIFFSPSGTTFEIGTSVVTLAATTQNGDLETCTFNVTVQEFFSATLQCHTNVAISLQQACVREYSAVEILNLDSTGCIDNYNVIRLSTGGNAIAPIINAFDLGQGFLTVVQHTNTSIQCVTQVFVNEGTPPAITCPADLTISCNVPLVVENVGYPDTTGCYNNIDIIFFDETANTLCPDSIGFQTKRSWVSTDPFGKKDTCEQLITGMRFDLNQVDFPPNYDGIQEAVLPCQNNESWETVAHPSRIGEPTYINFPLGTNPGCEISSNYLDNFNNICGAEFEIERVWTVINLCDPSLSVKDTQHIKIVDQFGPQFTIIDTIYASLSTDCTDSLFLPGAIQIEECSSFETEIITPWDTLYSNGGWTNIQLTGGSYSIKYKLTDACGNVTDSTNILKIENETLVTCPPNDTINCNHYFEVIGPALGNADFAVLNTLGVPEYHGNCPFDFTETDSVGVNGCGEGTLFRFLVSNSFIPKICNQEIQVVHVSDFTVLFPADTFICADPYVFSTMLAEPILEGINCENINVDFTDVVDSNGPEGCYTIKRNWQVENSCAYDGTNESDDLNLGDRYFMDGGDGLIRHLQTIVVNDSNAPVFVDSCGIPDLYLFANSCEITVTVPTPEVDGCRVIDLSLSGDLGTEMGANVQLTPANYEMTYTIEDECGRIEHCFTEFEVIDTIPPVAICDSFTVELMAPVNPGDEPQIDIWVVDLGKDSYDQCSGLQFSFFPDSSVIGVTHYCCDLGLYEYDVWVTDIYGNQSMCKSLIYVNPNIVHCDCDPEVSGLVATETGLGMEDIFVNFNSPNGFVNYTSTDENGFFFTMLPAGMDYTISPTKNTDHKNGVSTYDAVLITRHILGVDFLDSPYKIIAADINNSGAVSTFDIVELRRLILDIYTEFPNNTSWRFVPVDYIFPDPDDPWEEIFPEEYFINNFSQNIFDIDFIGIKIGDANNNASPN